MKNTLRPAGLQRYFVVALLFGAFTLAAYAALTRQASRVTDVVVEIQPTADGLFLIQGQDVTKRLDSGPQGALIGQAIPQLAYEPLERLLELDPYVAGAELYTGFDGKLHVTIEQNEPVLRVHHRGGPDYYVGPTGDVLPLSKHDVARVMVLTGNVRPFKEAVGDTVAIEAYRLARIIEQDELLRPLIEQIDLRGGEYTLIPKLGSAEFRLGKLDRLPAKIDRLKIFLQGVTPEVGWEMYQSIDLRYDGQVVCRKRPA